MTFDVGRTAVLAMDCQTGIVSVYAKPPEEFLERPSRVVRAARRAGMSVVRVRVGFRPGLPEVSGRNKLLAAIKSSSQHQKLFEGALDSTRNADYRLVMISDCCADLDAELHQTNVVTSAEFVDMLLETNPTASSLALRV